MDQLADFCAKYESQPRELLETIYEKKCYHLFLSAIPLFVQLIRKVDAGCPLVSEIILDLLQRKEPMLALLPRIPMLHDGFILEEAVKRKIAIDFTYPLFTDGCKAFYYETILKKDCVELFLLYKDAIIDSTESQSFYKFLTQCYSLKILRCLDLSQQQCDWCVFWLYDEVQSQGLNNKIEELLFYLCSLYDYHDFLSLRLLRTFGNPLSLEPFFLAKVLPNPNDATKLLLRTKNPMLFGQLFGEDV